MEGIVHHHHHNQQQQRKRLTLTEHMSVLDTSNLQDLLRVRDNNNNYDDGRDRNALVGLTLGAVIGCEVVVQQEEEETSRRSRTLLDIITNEESGAAYRESTIPNNDEHSNKNSWKSFKDRLLLRRAGAALSLSSASSNSIDGCRMEISRPSLTGIRSSFSIPITIDSSTTSGIHGEVEIVEELDNINSVVPADEPVVLRLVAALEAEREEQRTQTSDVVVAGEEVRMMNVESAKRFLVGPFLCFGEKFRQKK